MQGESFNFLSFAIKKKQRVYFRLETAPRSWYSILVECSHVDDGTKSDVQRSMIVVPSFTQTHTHTHDERHKSAPPRRAVQYVDQTRTKVI